MNKLFLVFGFLIFAAPLHADPVHGYDVLGVAKYCKVFLNAPKLPAVSTLLRTFGDPMPCIEERIKQGGLTDVQYNLRDATCHRNKTCPAGTPSLTDWQDIKKLSIKVNEQAVKYPAVKFWISPYLEHDFKDPKIVKKACKIAVKYCPTCECINEPFSGARNKLIPLEIHGTKVSAWSVSGDGASIFDGDNIKNDGNSFQHRLAGKKFTFAWWNELNGRCQGEKDFTPISKRTNWPTVDQFTHAYQTLIKEEDPKQNAPSACKAVREIDAKLGEIHKPNAEKYCNGQTNENDPRGNKNLLIIKNKGAVGEKADILDGSGNKVGCFKYYGTFDGTKNHRWYSGNCSGDSPVQLAKKLGSEWGFVRFGNGECLRFNSLRRQGIYR